MGQLGVAATEVFLDVTLKLIEAGADPSAKDKVSSFLSIHYV